ncbi:hypothetical protein NUU61_008877 [Penicillium alfredii]|uniref:Transcription factor domain-containing protein n=1 Tax=Penicillium alfredii TaxID=1506179 RepID=A0A9W9JWM8_9EURO|nr:uncharacterized protein NUU61_008877 [Penicillium alfredii]KAJ5084298.1 hypothetical protein NUU61_008877 [Penicillium alfredii]
MRKQVDLMVSFQLGLPSNICLKHCDTKSPSNLTDSDFDVDTQVLTAPRSETEATGVLWFIAKDRQMSSFSRVCRDALSFRGKPEAEILQLDHEIRQMHTAIPAVLQARPLSDSIAGAPFLILTRSISKAAVCCTRLQRCVLRQSREKTGQPSQFTDVYNEFGASGRLHREGWMLTNFTMNDFLLGVMVLCLAVHTRKREHAAVDLDTENETLPLLKQAQAICVEKSHACRDVQHVSRAILIILNEPRASPGDHPRFLSPLQMPLAFESNAISSGLFDPFILGELEDPNYPNWAQFESLLSQSNG